MEPVTQLSLPLFDPPGFDELLTKRNAGRHLSVEVNGRLKRGWQVKFLPLTGKRHLVIPSYLHNAPEETKNALIDWALLPYPRRSDQKRLARRRRADLEKIIWRHIQSLPDVPRRISRFDAAAFTGKTQGLRYDLREVFSSVNSTCFNGTIKAIVRWGQPGSKTSYHTMKTDRHGDRHDTITIAGVYDDPAVPRFAVEAVMYHEMLHIAIPPVKRNGRNVVHGRDFKTAEKKFRYFEEWRTWERESLTKIVMNAKRRKKRR
jgi:SprT-like family